MQGNPDKTSETITFFFAKTVLFFLLASNSQLVGSP